MKVVYKYKLGKDRTTVISLPKGAQILSVQTQYDEPVIWALIDLDEKTIVPRVFEIIGTGANIYDGPMHSELYYIGTFQLNEGRLVFHVFELL